MVVYLIARVKYGHPKACVLAIDMRNNTVQGVAKFGTENQSSQAAMYSPCTLSECMNPATAPGNYSTLSILLSHLSLSRKKGQQLDE
jgi:hypothetical protein